MEGCESPNEELTPIYVGEVLALVPLTVYYAGELAIKMYIESTNEE